MAHIEIQGLTKNFGAFRALKRHRHRNRGEGVRHASSGPPGCGKTTTLRLIAGFLTPDAGSITVGGEVLSSPSRQRAAGAAAHGHGLPELRRLAAHVGAGKRRLRPPLHRLRPSGKKARVDQVLAAVGLEGLEDRHPGQLSGGQQQRVALARSLVVEPSILLLDEPLSNLDAKLRERMRSELKSLQRRTGITFIYVTHDQAEAMALSDRIAVFHARNRAAGGFAARRLRAAGEPVRRRLHGAGEPDSRDRGRAAKGRERSSQSASTA